MYYSDRVCNSPRMDRQAFVWNGGSMLAAYNLFVPILPRTKIEDGRKALPDKAGFPGGNEVRWFDNHSKLELLNNRFGGEFMGMTPVYNFADDGSLLLEGGYTWYGNHYTRPCQVFCEKVPRRFILKDLIVNAEYAKTGQRYNIWRRDAKGGEIKDDPKIPAAVSGNMMHNH